MVRVRATDERQEDEGEKSHDANKSSRNRASVQVWDIQRSDQTDEHEDREDERQTEGLLYDAEDSEEAEDDNQDTSEDDDGLDQEDRGLGRVRRDSGPDVLFGEWDPNERPDDHEEEDGQQQVFDDEVRAWISRASGNLQHSYRSRDGVVEHRVLRGSRPHKVTTGDVLVLRQGRHPDDPGDVWPDGEITVSSFRVGKDDEAVVAVSDSG